MGEEEKVHYSVTILPQMELLTAVQTQTSWATEELRSFVCVSIPVTARWR